MPDSTYFGDALRNAVNDKSVPQSRVDDMALRILRSIYAAGLADTPQTGTASIFLIFIDSVDNTTFLTYNDNLRRPMDRVFWASVAVRLLLLSEQRPLLTHVCRAVMSAGVQAR
jgi:beta-glucosidase-like glycosyl hydrolase